MSVPGPDQMYGEITDPEGHRQQVPDVNKNNHKFTCMCKQSITSIHNINVTNTKNSDLINLLNEIKSLQGHSGVGVN